MRVTASESVYKEDASARHEFSQEELEHARVLLRRLRFLEAQNNTNRDNPERAASAAAMHSRLEASALEWVLGPEGINFLAATETGEE